MAEEAKRVVRVRLSDEQMAELWKRVGGPSCERHAHEIERLRAALHASERGPVVEARYDGRCPGCIRRISEGDPICLIDGEWLCEHCWEDS